MNRKRVPMASVNKVTQRTAFAMTIKSLRGVWRNVDWTISLPLKEIPRPINTKKTVENVILASIWKEDGNHRTAS
jgi:hypothetical protein